MESLKEILSITKEAKNLPMSRMSLAEIRNGPMKMKPFAGEPKVMAKVMNHIIRTNEGGSLYSYGYGVYKLVE